MRAKITITNIKSELRKRVDDFDRYRLDFEISQEIVYIKCLSTGIEDRYEVDVDMGGKSLEKVIDELTPKVIKLIKICKEKSP
jgi:hypothetical protein